MKQLLIASTSTIHGSGYLEYLLDDLKLFFKNCNTILFIPYARPGGISHDNYTQIARDAFQKIDLHVKGIHEFESAAEAIKQADGIFTGGGNTFVLLSQLYKNNCIETLRDAVNSGIPYLGTSAGSNICGLTINTTNDMPIVYPPSLVPFNINPHYLDPIPNSTHKGETRETRIKEFHVFNTFPVIGLREGSWLEVANNIITLKGNLDARIFEYEREPYEVKPETTLQHLR